MTLIEIGLKLTKPANLYAVILLSTVTAPTLDEVKAGKGPKNTTPLGFRGLTIPNTDEFNIAFRSKWNLIEIRIYLCERGNIFNYSIKDSMQIKDQFNLNPFL